MDVRRVADEPSIENLKIRSSMQYRHTCDILVEKGKHFGEWGQIGQWCENSGCYKKNSKFWVRKDVINCERKVGPKEEAARSNVHLDGHLSLLFINIDIDSVWTQRLMDGLVWKAPVARWRLSTGRIQGFKSGFGCRDVELWSIVKSG